MERIQFLIRFNAVIADIDPCFLLKFRDDFLNIIQAELSAACAP